MNRPENDRRYGLDGRQYRNGARPLIIGKHPNPKPGFGTFQTQKPGFGKKGRVC